MCVCVGVRVSVWMIHSRFFCLLYGCVKSRKYVMINEDEFNSHAIANSTSFTEWATQRILITDVFNLLYWNSLQNSERKCGRNWKTLPLDQNEQVKMYIRTLNCDRKAVVYSRFFYNQSFIDSNPRQLQLREYIAFVYTLLSTTFVVELNEHAARSRSMQSTIKLCLYFMCRNMVLTWKKNHF